MLSQPPIKQQLNEIANLLRYNDGLSAKAEIEHILLQYQSNHEIYSHALYLRAWLAWSRNEYTAAQRFITLAIRKVQREDEHYLAVRLKQAEIENSLGHYAKALNIWLDVLKLAHPEEAPIYFSECYLGIGNFFLITEEYLRASDYFHYAFEFAKKTSNREMVIKTAIFLLDVLCKLKQTSQATHILESCWPLIHKGQYDPAHIASLHHYSGLVMFASNQFDAAHNALRQSLAINEEHHLLWGQTHNRMALAQILAIQGHDQQAITILEGAILIASEFDRGLLQQEICRLIRDIHREAGNFAAALSAQERFHQLAINNKNNIHLDTIKVSKPEYERLDNQLNVIKSNLTTIKLQNRIKKLEEKISRLRHNRLIDSLTQLPNRAALSEQYRTHSISIRPDNLPYISIKISNLPKINVEASFNIGDQVLSAISTFLKEIFASAVDHIYRYGGCEFLIQTTFDKKLATRLNESLLELQNKYQLKIILAIYDCTLQLNSFNDALAQCDALIWHFDETNPRQII